MSNFRLVQMLTPSGCVANGYMIIQVEDGEYLWNWNNIICFVDRQGNVTMDKLWERHGGASIRNHYLGVNEGNGAKTIRNRVKSGEYKVACLNIISPMLEGKRVFPPSNIRRYSESSIETHNILLNEQYKRYEQSQKALEKA